MDARGYSNQHITGKMEELSAETVPLQYVGPDLNRNSLTLKAQLAYKLQQTTIEPRHEISNNEVCATSKGANQPTHTRSLI